VPAPGAAAAIRTPPTAAALRPPARSMSAAPTAGQVTLGGEVRVAAAAWSTTECRFAATAVARTGARCGTSGAPCPGLTWAAAAPSGASVTAGNMTAGAERSAAHRGKTVDIGPPTASGGQSVGFSVRVLSCWIVVTDNGPL